MSRFSLKLLFTVIFACSLNASADFNSAQREYQNQQSAIGMQNDENETARARSRQLSWAQQLGRTHGGITVTRQTLYVDHGNVQSPDIQFTTGDGFECDAYGYPSPIAECYGRLANGQLRQVTLGRSGKIIH